VKRVAISPRSFRETPGEHLDLLVAHGFDPRYPQVGRRLTEPEMVELVAGCWGLIVGIDPVTSRVLDAGPLRAVVKYGAGVDNLDLKAAAARGVEVRATPGANARSVAELTVGLILSLTRRIPQHDRLARRGTSSRWTGVELRGRRLGLIGLGAIGSEVAALAGCLGMEVVAHDPGRTEADVPLLGFEELLASSDVVSLHCPLTEETRGLIGPAEIDRMRQGAFLVNTARAGLVEEEALAEAVKGGRLAGAALDDVAHDPPQTSPLLHLEDVIVTPHAGAATREAAIRTGVAAVEALAELAEGSPS
jgi:D-3-phosphoglycerate dehydrogenase / 2-oxoglutarate reductase